MATQKTTIRIAVWLPEELERSIRDEAEKRGTTVNQMVGSILRQGVNCLSSLPLGNEKVTQNRKRLYALIPFSLHEKLAELAKRHERSINSTCAYILGDYFKRN